jgi:hypothetical protein
MLTNCNSANWAGNVNRTRTRLNSIRTKAQWDAEPLERSTNGSSSALLSPETQKQPMSLAAFVMVLPSCRCLTGGESCCP